DEAFDKGGDENSESLGYKMGQAAAISIGAIASGGSGTASKSLTLSRMGIDISSKKLEEIATTVKLKGLKKEIAELERPPGRDSDVPMIEPETPPRVADAESRKITLPSYYREDSSAGASFNKTGGLPEGYQRVINTRTGNVEVAGPDGTLYLQTADGGLTPKAGGNLAQLVKAEREIAEAKATVADEVPATSAIARVGLRDDLAAQAGIPRNIAESPSSMWGKSIDDIKQSLTLDGASLTPKAPLAGTSGKAQVFNVEGHPKIKEVEFHPGGGTHGDSPYYKLVSTEKIDNKNIEIRVIDPSPDFSPGTITRYQQYYDTQGNRLKYEGGEWKGWK
ncbi:hypothetical protein SAMN05216593_1251, partial [Pseudomonas asturiensis]